MANLHAHKLSAAFVKSAPVGRHTDSHGLMLVVQASGTRSWIQRIVIQGKRRDMGLGGYPMVSLSEAREKALANRKRARNGEDPRFKPATAVPTFREATMVFHAIHAPTWKNDRQRAQWLDEVKRVVWPAIGQLPINAITTGQLTGIFSPIWLSKPVLANRVRQRTEKVIEWAISQGHRTDNPAAAPLKANLPKQPKGGHQKAIPHTELPGAIRTVRQSTSSDMTKLAFEFLVLTATRKSETLEARWSEIDLDARTWTIPAARMKAGRDHRIPLSNAAMDVLARVKAMSANNRSGFVFVSPRGNRLDPNTMNKMLAKVGIAASPHGFRSSFKGWSMDNGMSHTATEFSLAHTVADKTEAAYSHTTDVFETRRGLMEQWGEYVTT